MAKRKKTLIYKYLKACEDLHLAVEDLLFLEPNAGDDHVAAAKDAWYNVMDLKHDLEEAATYGQIVRHASATSHIERMGWLTYHTPGDTPKKTQGKRKTK